jgi:hypothetical protein
MHIAIVFAKFSYTNTNMGAIANMLAIIRENIVVKRGKEEHRVCISNNIHCRSKGVILAILMSFEASVLIG